jgi:hypothetical protein
MNISKLSLENAHIFLEDFEEQINPKDVQEYNNYECSECRGELIFSNFFLTCIECGLTDLDECEMVYFDDYDAFIRKRSFYKRKLYAIEKLYMMTCRKPCKKANYDASIKILAKKKFETIFELKKHMKDLKMNKLYPYIYLAFFDIKKVKLIYLSENQIDKITTEFVKTESQFKSCKIKRKNMLSYYALIYLTMKHLGYAGYEHIILPNNFKKIKESYDIHLVV